MSILSKKQMSEEDIKLNFITPAVQPGWSGHITMETRITDGRINIKGNIVARSKPKFADYMLYLNDGKPIAVLEAKDNNHSVSYGLQQAMTYAQMMDLPFAYSSNGDAFFEHDFLTGKERQIDIDKFPTQEELIARYYAELNKGKGITEEEKKIIQQPYYSSQSTYPPRYYQRNAVNRTVEAISRGQERLLLVMATGTGKTYTAFQIVYRLLKSGLKSRILYLADRNILVDQSIQQDFEPLEKTIYKVDFSDKDCLNKISSHEVNFALYHQMVGQHDEEHFRQIPEGYFDLIIVDECHRGSAKEDSNWRKVLEYFSSATQIGMTATPRESETISNIDYFGDPVYTYSLKQGIYYIYLPQSICKGSSQSASKKLPRNTTCKQITKELDANKKDAMKTEKQIRIEQKQLRSENRELKEELKRYKKEFEELELAAAQMVLADSNQANLIIEDNAMARAKTYLGTNFEQRKKNNLKLLRRDENG